MLWPLLHLLKLNYASLLHLINHVRLFATPWTVVHLASLTMEFLRQEYWSGLPCPSPGHLPDPWIEPASLVSPSLAGAFFSTSVTDIFVYFSSGISGSPGFVLQPK